MTSLAEQIETAFQVSPMGLSLEEITSLVKSKYGNTHSQMVLQVLNKLRNEGKITRDKDSIKWVLAPTPKPVKPKRYRSIDDE